MKLNLIVGAVVFAIGAFAATAQAAPVWTLTAEGTINNGTDNAGVFGTVGGDLHGVAFKQTITVSVDPAKYGTHYQNDWSESVYGTFPGFTESVTINGKTFTYSVTQPIYAQQLVQNGATQQNNSSDMIYSYQYGNDNQQNQISGVIQAFANYPIFAFIPKVDFSQKLTAIGSTVNTYSSASLISSTGHQQFYFAAYPAVITTNADETASDVPEPASLALFALGAAGLAALRRRKAS